MSPALVGRFLTTSATWEALFNIYLYLIIHLAAPDLSCTCNIFSCNLWNIVPESGIKPGPPVLGAQSLSHWTTLFKHLKTIEAILGPKMIWKQEEGQTWPTAVIAKCSHIPDRTILCYTYTCYNFRMNFNYILMRVLNLYIFIKKYTLKVHLRTVCILITKRKFVWQHALKLCLDSTPQK